MSTDAPPSATGPSRRQWLQTAAGLGLAPGWAVGADGQKVLRIAFANAETGFDPTQVNDIYSRGVTSHIFEALYAFDHLARPAHIKPLTAEGMPQVSDDFRTWTFRVRPGIFFADDPAFGGRRRELVAEDYVYAIKRYADPRLKSPLWGYTDSYGLLGLVEARQRAIDGKRAFDYDAPIEGLRSLDRTTLQIRLREPRPRLLEFIAASDLYGAVAREVVEHYGDTIMEHPVGTGPFRLAQWRRASRIVLTRNPQYRARLYDAEPAADDAEGQALLARFKGRRLPMVDRVEIDIVEEAQPRWLAFLNGEHDLIDRVPAEFISQAVVGDELAPHLVKRGVQGRRTVRADYYATFFNMEDPLVGGYTPERIALRRAIALGMDVAREIRIVHRGQGLACQSPYCPESTAWRPDYKSEMGDFDPARAQALLDLYGYTDRDGDGWREQPDGAPLTMVWSIEDNQRARQISEQYLRDMTRLGLRIEFKVGKWPELVKAARAGQFQVWHIGNQAATPDSLGQLTRYDSRQLGSQNFARFKRPEMDALFDRLARQPDGPARLADFAEAARIAAVWMPYRVRFHTIQTWLAHAPVIGYRPPPFWQEWWHMVDVVR